MELRYQHIKGSIKGECAAKVLQQAKVAARGFRNINNFITIAYLRMAKLVDLPTTPFLPAMQRRACVHRYVGGRQVPHETS